MGMTRSFSVTSQFPPARSRLAAFGGYIGCGHRVRGGGALPKLCSPLMSVISANRTSYIHSIAFTKV
jgi:hypothetical protein